MRIPIMMAVVSLFFCACKVSDSNPLIFAQGVSAGVTIAANPTAGNTPELVIGVKNADVAVVPTIVPASIPDVTGHENVAHGRQILANSETDDNGVAKYDALSTLGNFSLQTGNNSGQGKAQNVGLGIFFATGVAAQKLSEGFRCSVAAGLPADCTAATTP